MYLEETLCETNKYIKMAKINLTCKFCEKIFEREKREYTRSLKLGRDIFCSISCGAKLNRNLPSYSSGNYEFIKGFTRRDQFTPFRYHLRKAKSRDVNSDLTLDYLKEIWESQNGICIYSGIKLNERSYKGGNDMNTASLDRVDSSQGYIKGNVQFVSMNINFLKHTLTHEEMIFLCKQIANFWNNL